MSIAPGRKQPIPASVVVVSIADILDQGDLDLVDLVGSVTVNGLPFEPDAWAWRARGATTGIDDPTVGETVFEPPEVGTYTVTLNALVEGVWHAATTPRTFSAGTGAPPIVIATISSIADVTSGTTAKTPTVSATIDRGDGLGAVPATITAWAWKQDDSTANITGPTTATPSIAIVGGRHVVTCGVTIGGVVYQSAPEVYVVSTAYVVSIGSQADALGLTGVQFAAPTATKDGAPIAITAWAWTVSGPATLDDDEIERPTPTHTGAGIVTRQLTATLADGAVVASAMDGWRVGDTEGFLYWIVDFSDPAYDGHDFVSTGTLTVNGETLEKSGSGSGACPAGNLVVTGGKLKVQTTAAHGLLGIGFGGGPFGGAEPVDYALGAAFDTTLSADGDGVWAYWPSTIVIAQRHGGVQKMLAENATPTTYRYTIPSGVQPKAVESRIIGRYVFRAQYTHSALTPSTIPLSSEMSKIPKPPSGNMTRAAVPPGTSADVVSATDGGWYCEHVNSRRYDINFIWIRWKPGPL